MKQNSKMAIAIVLEYLCVFCVPCGGSVRSFIYVALDSSRCAWHSDVNVFLW